MKAIPAITAAMPAAVLNVRSLLTFLLYLGQVEGTVETDPLATWAEGPQDVQVLTASPIYTEGAGLKHIGRDCYGHSGAVGLTPTALSPMGTCSQFAMVC